MGLDSVELVMEFEEAFGIDLEEDEVTEVRTPRMAVDLILSKIQTVRESTCLSQRAFYLLRRKLMERLGIARRAIRPDTNLEDLIDVRHAGLVWPTLEQALQVRAWPPLARPALLTASVFLLAAIAGIGVFLLSLPTGIISAAGAAWMVMLLFLFGETFLTERWRTRLPGNLRSIRDLVPYVGTSDQIAWTPEKVSLTVKVIVMEQLGVCESDYDEDADFIRDLGMD